MKKIRKDLKTKSKKPVKKKISKLEESSLENKVEKANNIPNKNEEAEKFEFSEGIRQPLISQRVKAPVLEELDISEPVPRFFGRALGTATSERESDEDSFKYLSEKRVKEEHKYEASEKANYSNLIASPDRIINLGKEQGRDLANPLKQVAFAQSPEIKSSEERKYEKYEQVKRFDEEESKKAEREMVFGKKEIKYKPLN